MSLSDFNQLLSELAQADQLRVRRIVDGPQDTSMVIDGQRMMSYASNDYLGLANHPKVVEPAMRALKRYGPVPRLHLVWPCARTTSWRKSWRPHRRRRLCCFPAMLPTLAS
jgi:7-keto-8-aminopelargonate synthetase-like enzyme